LLATSNIGACGDVVDATETTKPEEIKLIERAAAVIPELHLAGFDVLLPRQPGENRVTILEDVLRFTHAINASLPVVGEAS
jgi:D-alanine-D-alanine ligase-like ATP-grasp enzyme